MLKEIKERDINYMTKEEVADAIKKIEKFGLKDLQVEIEPVVITGNAPQSEPVSEQEISRTKS